MTIEAIIAIAAALIALGALWFTRSSTRAAERSADAADRSAQAAEDQTRIQRQLRIDAAQPYVWVDLRPDEKSGQLIKLVLGNAGPTVATDVTVTFDPPLTPSGPLGKQVEDGQKRLSRGIASLTPGRIIAWSVGPSWEVIAAGDPNIYTVTVRGTGPFGALPALTYVINLEDLRHSSATPLGTLHGLTEAVKELEKKIK